MGFGVCISRIVHTRGTRGLREHPAVRQAAKQTTSKLAVSQTGEASQRAGEGGLETWSCSVRSDVCWASHHRKITYKAFSCLVADKISPL